jgi:hypothetical protein
VVAVVACTGLLLDKLFRGPLPIAPLDLTAFWAAGRLTLTGENPYDPVQVRDLQRGLGVGDTAIVVWNPPWVLPVVAPLGTVSFRTAYGVWVLATLALMGAAAGLLWAGLGGPPRRVWLAYLVAVTFVPTAFLLGSGQVTSVVLVGLAGFLWAARRDRPVLAGAFAALTAIKPHLFTLFALWLLLEAARTRFARRVVLGGLAVGLVLCLLPTLANPDIWGNYLRVTTGPSSADHYHLSRWTPPLAGWWLRQAVPGHPFWVQWVPLAAAVIGFGVWYGTAARPPADRPPPAAGRADWLAPVPWLVGVSLLAAPYGVWEHDLVMLLVPVLAVAARLARAPDPVAVAVGAAWLVAANGVMLAMMLGPTSSEWYVWVTPWVLLGCAVTLRVTGSREPALQPAGA